MGAQCCIIGQTEKETLRKTCQWMAGWAEGLAKNMQIVQSILGHMSDAHPLNCNHDGAKAEELAIQLDTVRTLATGLLACIRSAYRDEDGIVLPHLARAFKNAKDEAGGRKPIATSDWFSWNDDAANAVQSRLGKDTKIVRVQGDQDYWYGRQYDDFKEGISKALSKVPMTEKVAVVFADKQTAKRFFQVSKAELPPGETAIGDLANYFKSLYPNGIKFLYRHDMIDECDFEKEIVEERRRAAEPASLKERDCPDFCPKKEKSKKGKKPRR